MILLKLIAKLTKGKIVILEDHENEIYYTIAYPHPFDSAALSAYVYPFTKVGPIKLYPYGVTTGRSYIKRWKYL